MGEIFVLTGRETPIPGWRGGDGNAAYLDKTLRHQPIELGLNESVDGRVILGLWLRAALIASVVEAIPVLIGMASAFGGGSSGFDPYGEPTDSGGSGMGWFVFAAILGFGAFVVMLLFTRITEPVAEWRVLLADRFDRADVAYRVINETLASRGYPVTPVRDGNRLKLVMGPYSAYVSVFSYGTSLYLGWMMWRSRRGSELIARYFGDLVLGMKGQNTIEKQLLRSEGARAMREAVHLACREGLMVAVEIGASGAGAVGPWPADPARTVAGSPPMSPPVSPQVPPTPWAPPPAVPPRWGPESGSTAGA